MEEPRYLLSHTTDVIACSHTLPLNDEVFTKELRKIALDSPVAFSNGIGVIPWTVQENCAVAVTSSKLMKQYDVVVWPRHGMFASGEDTNLTFNATYAVENVAESLVKMISVGQYILQNLMK